MVVKKLTNDFSLFDFLKCAKNLRKKALCKVNATPAADDETDENGTGLKANLLVKT